MTRRYGLLTDLQIKVVKLRSRGLTLREVARILGTSHQNVAVAEKRAMENIRLARDTLIIYDLITSVKKIIIDKGTHLVDIPKIVLKAGDEAGVKIRADFTFIYKLIRYRVPECIDGSYVSKPILITIDSSGSVNVYDYDKVREFIELIESI